MMHGQRNIKLCVLMLHGCTDGQTDGTIYELRQADRYRLGMRIDSHLGWRAWNKTQESDSVWRQLPSEQQAKTNEDM